MKRYLYFLAAMGLAMGSATALAATQQGGEDSTFQAADANGDGVVDRDEYFAQEFRTETQLSDEWFTRADEDDDGVLDSTEYTTADSVGLGAFGVGG